MIVRGTIANGGWTAEEGGELLVRISIDEMTGAGGVMPSTLRGRPAVLVLGDQPAELAAAIARFSCSEAVIPSGDDAHTVEAGTTPPTVEE